MKLKVLRWVLVETVVVLICLCVCASLSSASELLDQSFTPASFNAANDITAGVFVGQSFTPGVSGRLSRVEMLLVDGCAGDSPIEDLLVTVHAGTSATNPLASATISGTNIPRQGACSFPAGAQAARFVSATFPNGGIAISAGQLYSIWLRPNSTGAPARWYGLSNGEPYDRGIGLALVGTTFVPLTTTDWAFKTYVTFDEGPPPVTVTRTISGEPGNWTLTFSVTNNLPEGFDIYAFSVADIPYGIVGSPISWDEHPDIPFTFATGIYGYTGPSFPVNNSWCVFGSCFVSIPNNGTTITGFQIHSTDAVPPMNLTYVVTALNLTNGNPPAPGCLNCGINPVYLIRPPISVAESVSGGPGDWTLTFSVTNNLPQGFDIYAFEVADLPYGIVGSPTSWDEHPDIPFTFATGIYGYTGPSFPVNNSWCVFGSCFVSIPNNGTTITGFQIHSTEAVAPTNRTYVIAALNLTNNNPPAPGCLNCGINPVYVLFNRVNQAALTVNAPATLTYGTTAILSANGGSGTGALTFSTGTSTGCAVVGDQLSVADVTGTCRVTATKASDTNYNASESAPATVTLRDPSPPQLTCGTSDGVWHSNDVVISCTASDPESGLVNAGDAAFNLTTNTASGAETASADTDSRQICNRAGNCVIAGPVGGNKIDKKGPSISIASPRATDYPLNALVAASYSCADSGSGAATCQGTLANGAGIDTTTTGQKTFTVSSRDNVGNLSTASLNYNVVAGGGGGSTSADLSISMRAEPSSPIPGRTLTYFITIVNLSKTIAADVVVDTATPMFTTFVGASTPQGTINRPPIGSSGPVKFNLGTLSNGPGLTMQLTVNVNAPSKTVQSNTAIVSATTPDLNRSNNSYTVSTKVK